ncbi:ribose 5-phosphate isomerase B [Fervidobacterium pennivorans subsp. carthaginiensis]|uniref:ribose 5-phosphate isomerase B n=1 Tax=Fervidobacterium pennivorans TaxID=93466 RepID=UPI001436B280|nr:ribose 5-phosphate isomerase B [Fervidobacterium pennivorans]QIV78493.1 ribose 5-phosphate isomerase B [Fervidobacterium pennivorans subsp. keratinolyticus]
MKIAIGSDHAAFELKERVKEYLRKADIEVIDCGTYSIESVDYPDYAKKVAEKVTSKECDFGILMCGTGIGMSIAANKIKGVRAALCLFPEMAAYARKHNDANILVLPGRLMGIELAKWTVDAFLNSSFEGGRHERRVKKIEELEK